jgi:precorrin-6B methylase 2
VADLEAKLGRAGFTPGVRDAPALVDLVVAGDERLAPRAASALAQLGEVGRQALVQAIEAGRSDRAGPEPASGGEAGEAGRRGATRELDDGARARLVSALGQLARAGDDAARARVIAALDDRTPRVRKAAVIALGKLPEGQGADEARRALLARWDAPDAPADERRALVEALGKLGGADALARLRALEPGGDAELARRRDRALLVADRDARRDQPSEVATDVRPPAPIALVLGCRAGLEPLLAEELTALGRAPRVTAHGVELVLGEPLAALFASRLWATLAIPIALPPGDPADAITRAITAPSTRALLATWTRGPIRWRLGFARGHQRAIVWRVARDVTAAAPELINDPTATTWDFTVEHEAGHGEPSEHERDRAAPGRRSPASPRPGGEARRSQARRAPSEPARSLVLAPRRFVDPRFAWRVADVPAASHPTVAAALAWVAEPRPDDRVWDPFCGSGVELVERARRGPCRSLLGSDLDPSALEAARANLAAAGVAAELVLGDARSHAAGPVDLIVTNPPLGGRLRGDAAALLGDALPHFARQLAPGGRLVWITPAPRRTTPVAERLGLRRTRALPVDLGGMRGQLERWDRR